VLVANPANIINTQLFLLISVIPFCAPVRKTAAQATVPTTAVLIAAAKLELTPCMPTLANIDASAVHTADNNAKISHIKIAPPNKTQTLIQL
jgi:hypothetical protein